MSHPFCLLCRYPGGHPPVPVESRATLDLEQLSLFSATPYELDYTPNCLCSPTEIRAMYCKSHGVLTIACANCETVGGLFRIAQSFADYAHNHPRELPSKVKAIWQQNSPVGSK